MANNMTDIVKDIFDVTSTLKGLFGDFVKFLPNLVFAFILLIIGLILSKLVQKGLKTLLSKIGVDKLSNQINEIDFLDKNRIVIKLSTLISKLAYYVVLLVFVLLAVDMLGLDVLTEQLNKIIEYIPNFFTAAVILFVGLLISEAARKAIHSTLKSLGLPSANLISAVVFYFLIINILLTALSQANFDTEFIGQNITLIIGGLILAMALGYGLASKDLASNLIASFYSAKKIDVGNQVTIGEVTGKIVAKDSTTMTIDDGENEVIVPMHKLTTDEIKIKKI